MGKIEYLEALKRAMTGLPPETQAKTLAYYEQRFVDGTAAGRSEEEVGQELDDPKKIAMTLRANTHLDAIKERKTTPASVLRLLVSAVGLAIFNLFMVVPAAVFGALLTALYVCAAAFYFSGVVVSASALAGTNEFVFNHPLRHVVIQDDRGRSGEATVTIGSHGIEVTEQKNTPNEAGEAEDAPEVARVVRDRSDGRIRVFTEMNARTRPAQMAAGAGLVVGGIALLLMALVITRYTFIGIKRYLQMNLSLLKGS
jgi:uncharacterized membrane protein